MTAQIKLAAWDDDARCQSCGGLGYQEFAVVYRGEPAPETAPRHLLTVVGGLGTHERAPGYPSAKACECKQRKKAGEAATRRASATKLAADMTWKNWNQNPEHPTRQTEIIARSRTPPRAIVWTSLARWQPSDPPVYIYGEHRLGKTHALAALCRRLIYDDGIAALHRSVKHLLSQEQASYNSASREVSPFERAAEAPVLLLDDLGAERMTPWVAETLFGLIDKRVLGKRPTIYASNHDPETLKRHLTAAMGTSKAEADHIRENGLRIHARVMERANVFEFKAKDRR